MKELEEQRVCVCVCVCVCEIITGDETWVYEYDVEIKMQSSQ